MDLTNSKDVARPAKASSTKRRGWFGPPPWIRARLDEEQRLRAEAERMGIDPNTLLKPNSPELQRVLDTAQAEFEERQAVQHAKSDRSLPF